MSPNLRFLQLSLPRQTLIRLCQAINYGHIQGLSVRDKEPTFTPAPVLVTDVKLDQEEGPRPEAELTDFDVPAEIRRLFLKLDEMRSGRIEKIEVRGGIPRRVLFALEVPELLP